MNLLNGDFAAGSLGQALRLPGDEILVSRDVLSCGPLKTFESIDAWIPFRQRLWNKVLADNAVDPVSFDEGPRDLYAHLDEFRSGEKIDLWLASGLSDQLMLAFVITLFDHFGLDFGRLSIVQFTNSMPGNRTVRGIGELNAEQIEQHPEAFKLDDEQTAYCLHAWQAVVNDTPDKYLELINASPASLPVLHKALSTLLYRYPKQSNGLALWDEKILNGVKLRGPRASRVIGYTLTEDELEGGAQHPRPGRRLLLVKPPEGFGPAFSDRAAAVGEFSGFTDARDRSLVVRVRRRRIERTTKRHRGQRHRRVGRRRSAGRLFRAHLV